MKLASKIKNVLVEVITLLFILLFVYAAVSKLLDFENFQVQLGQSPLLSAFAFWVSWLVPISEIAIAFSLMIPKFRYAGLFLSLGLMTMFTAYIFIILHYSSFVPCSCGGILEKMSWNIHLVFNIVFVILAIIAIIFIGAMGARERYLKDAKSIVSILALSIGAVVILFISSEDIMHYNNPFQRRYTQHPAVFSDAIDLRYNSYYIAGADSNKIYLGNYTNPLQILSLDQNLRKKQIERISFNPGRIPFKSVVITVKGTYFYLADGSVPVIFRGSLKNWKINMELKGMPYFTLAVPMDSSSIVFRGNNSKNAANVLGIFKEESSPKVSYNRDLLQSQLDGIFDTDGTLLYGDEIQRIIYLYHYRNGFTIAHKDGTLDYRGHTIDTVKHAKIKTTVIDNGKQHAMSSPPYVVNARAAVYKNLLFVHSKVKGKFENDALWKKSFIIDVYDLRSNAYLMSFPIYHTASNRLDYFTVTGSYIYAIIGRDLVAYKIQKILKKEMKSN